MKDYYAILGISSSADAVGVRHAYRDLAMRHHPDRAGAASTRHFQEIAEAYAVLGDRGRRAAYDQGRQRTRGGPQRTCPMPDVPAEPFDASPATRWRGRRPAGWEFFSTHGALTAPDEILEQLLVEYAQLFDLRR